MMWFIIKVNGFLKVLLDSNSVNSSGDMPNQINYNVFFHFTIIYNSHHLNLWLTPPLKLSTSP